MLKFTSLVLTSLVPISVIVLLSSCTASAPLNPIDSQTAQTASSIAPLSYADYGIILQTYVNANGLVDYSALQENPQPLKALIAEFGAVSPDVYQAWSEQDKIAFLLNAYNAITLESIIDQKPLKSSIRDIFGVWNFKTHTLVGQARTLDAIEHQILRREFNEPRIHAALVCAAISCPPLRQEPYVGEDLNTQLEDQVRRWLAGPHGIEIDRTQNRVLLSQIFNWFGEDWLKTYETDQFVGNEKERAVLNFISNYLSPEDQQYLQQGQYRLDYLNYDWSLNSQ
jgi:Protein of unknown function, DUF547